ncbi:transcription regulator [Secundilactobacillus paracollinoides DSM 15502 = JCM 11969]|nr:transcription regulator [Secundilactobacillus paracollinoides DSM 15502 = JCM 11969]
MINNMKKKDTHKTEQLLQAARDIIISDGVAAVPTTKVAKMVGIAQSNVYIYFKNKDELLLSVFHHEQARVKAFFDARIDQTADLTTRLKAYIDAMGELAMTEWDTMTILEQIKAMPHTPVAAEDALPSDDQTVQALMQDGIDAGILKPVDPRFHMTVVFGLVRRYSDLVRNHGYSAEFAPIRAMIWDAVAV